MTLMLSLMEYEHIACKILKKNNYCIDQDLVGEVITAIAMADYKYDPAKGKLQNFRTLYAKYYLGNINRSNRRRKKEVLLDTDIINDKNLIKVRKNTDNSSKELLEHIEASNIPELQKRVIKYRFWYQHTFKEIAAIENFSITKAKRTLDKALQNIKDVL